MNPAVGGPEEQDEVDVNCCRRAGGGEGDLHQEYPVLMKGRARLAVLQGDWTHWQGLRRSAVMQKGVTECARVCPRFVLPK